MDEEARELLRSFYRRWSTQELTEAARVVLRQDVVQVKAMLFAMGEDASLLDGALEAESREWFAETFRFYQNQ